ncbi:MAG: choice-of-anchor D domain-containing protein [Verrucomicrobia bacterium]|nr:choice-of-anchor D domain-containing protein [Verrucomicrobiota bacterium]
MHKGFLIAALACAFATATLSVSGATVPAVFNAPTDIAVTAAGYVASGNDVACTLNFAPAPGTELTVVRNTGVGFIVGAFTNLAHGQVLTLTYAGQPYRFVANYYGGDGNDLVLTWSVQRALGWGDNQRGQLGDGSETPRTAPTRVLDRGVLAGRIVTKIAAGGAHTLALTSDGLLAAWGANTNGQLGFMTSDDLAEPGAVQMTGTPLSGRAIAALSAGVAHSLALCSDGTLVAWGLNSRGQVGDGSTLQRNFPVAVATVGTPLAGRSVVAVASGGYHNLALCADGTLVAWGLNVYGQLGDGSTTDRSAPVAVVTTGTPLAGRTVVAIAAGRHYSAALCADGTLATWGDNSSGQLGDGTVSARPMPGSVTVAGTALAGRQPTALVAGGNYLLVPCTDGTLVAWGYNAYGQLGDGTTTERHTAVVVPIAGTALAGRSIAAMAAGAFHSLALCTDGTLAAWGRNDSGQLGDGTTTQRNAPVAVTAPLAGRWTAVAAGCDAFHSLALAAYPPAPEIAVFVGSTTAPASERQSGGSAHVFAPTPVGGSSAAQTFTIQNTGTAPLTGLAVSVSGAQPGDFTVTPPLASSLAPEAVTTFTVTFTPTAGGTRTANVLLASNDADENPFVLPVSGTQPTPEIAVYVGASTAAADERQSGIGTSSFDPVVVGASGPARTFTVRNVGTADLTGLSLALAGANAADFSVTPPLVTTLAPDATTTFTVTFAPGAAGLRVAQVEISSNDADENPFLLALAGTAYLPGGTVTATYSTGLEVPVTAAGYTAAGKLLNLSLAYAPVAGTQLTVVQNTSLSPIVGVFDNLAHGQSIDLAFGGRVYRFVADYYGGSGNDLVLVWAAQRMLAWGYNGYGTLGDSTNTDRSVPVPMTVSSALAGQVLLQVASGAYHALALCADGRILAWGQNGQGQLGNGTTGQRAEATLVPTAGTPLAGRRVVAIAAGENHSLALCSDGTLVAWGANASGQLGDGTTTGRLLPTALPTAGTPLAARTVVAISAGAFHNLALCSDGTLVAWGQNNAGQVGDGTTTQRNAPVVVTTDGTPLAGRTAAQLVAGGSYNLVLCSDGTLVAWGQNADGQLGDGTNSARSTAVAVLRTGTPLASRTVVGLAAGTSHSLALCADGTVAAWGWNTQGQLGDGTTASRNAPVAVSVAGSALAGRTVTGLAGGSHHSLAVCADGSLVAWGYNNSGQLGDGTLVQRPTPVLVNASALLGDERFARLARGSHAFQHSRAFIARAPAPEIAVFTGLSPLPAAERVSGATFAFADTPLGARSATQWFTVVNSGTADLTGLGAALSGAQAGDYRLEGAALPATLPPGGSASFGVSFAPTAPGARNAAVGLASNDADENPFVIALTGATPTPEIAVFNGASTAPVDERQSNVGVFIFDGVGVGGSSAPQTFTIRNQGTAELTGLLITRSGAQPDDFLVNTGGLASTLAPGASTSFTVVFTPGGAGPRSATLQIVSDDADENPFLIRLANDVLQATYVTGSEVPVTANGFTATGRQVALQLQYAPVPGTELTVVRNTSRSFIQGVFANLAHGQVVSLYFGGVTYQFVANYYGGDGNDLVLQWANVKLHAWGQNTWGQVGDNSTTDRRLPTPVVTTGPLGGKVVLRASSSYSHTLALCSDGALLAWGSNSFGGPLGDGTIVDKSVPVSVVTAGTPLATRRVVAISASAGFNLVLCSDGSLASWGLNGSGQLGDGTTTERHTPVAVVTAGTPLAGRSVVGLATGIGHCLALCSDGTLVAWGANSNGQLGDGTTTSRSLPVAVVTAGTPLAGRTVVALTAGDNHSLALCSDGTLVGWGQNWAGQVGDGTTATRLLPVAVTTSGNALTGRTAVAVAAGNNHCYALCSDNTIVAWGDNGAGQLGDGTTTGRPSAVAVTSAGTALAGRTVTRILGGVSQGMAYCTDGTLATWGMNASGQLGDNTVTNRSLAVAVSSLPLAVSERYRGVFGGATARHLLTLVAAPPPPAPEVAVFDGASTASANERQSGVGLAVFTPQLVGSAAPSRTFTVQNVGTATLTGLAASMTGPHASDFAPGALGTTTLAPGASTTFTVACTPAGQGTRSANLQLASNDGDENPFVIALRATGLSALEHWRLTNFGSADNAGLGADYADYDQDGVPNLVEYALGLDPTRDSSAALPQAQLVGSDVVLAFTAPAGQTGVTYRAEWSDTLQAGSWTLVPDTGTPPQHVFSVPVGTSAKVFLRLRISSP